LNRLPAQPDNNLFLMEKIMKSKFVMAGLLSSYAGAGLGAANNGVNEKICDLFAAQRSGNVIASYERKSDNGKLFCAQILRTDDEKMLELVIFRKDQNGDVVKFGGMNGDDDRIYLLPNKLDSWSDRKAYVGITCNSSQGCETGETFIASIEGDGGQLFLRTGKYSNNEGPYFVPTELKDGIELTKVK
jgi:hypothetical protein